MQIKRNPLLFDFIMFIIFIMLALIFIIQLIPDGIFCIYIFFRLFIRLLYNNLNFITIMAAVFVTVNFFNLFFNFNLIIHLFLNLFFGVK